LWISRAVPHAGNGAGDHSFVTNFAAWLPLEDFAYG
jgi:hypothetical protein